MNNIKLVNHQEGLLIHKIDTPALLLDAELLESNLVKMAKYSNKEGFFLRPHIKTHKCPIIAHKQIQHGAIGITCAKVSEAEIMGYSGIQNILIANQVVTSSKIERIVSLGRHCNIVVAVDSLVNAQVISRIAQKHGEVIDVVIECNIGMNRCGTNSPKETIQLAEGIYSLRGLNIRGLMGYEGHTVYLMPQEDRIIQCTKAITSLLEHKEALIKKGFNTEITSAGGTGTYDITGKIEGITDIQAGSYATMDLRYRDVGLDFYLALSLLSTIISRPSKNTAIIDVGIKAVTKEFGFPIAKGINGVTFSSLSEEHGKLELSGDSLDLRVGDTLELIPSHGCTTINLHDNFYVHRHGLLEAIWPIAARGAFN